jgi:hypothetical protein
LDFGFADAVQQLLGLPSTSASSSAPLPVHTVKKKSKEATVKTTVTKSAKVKPAKALKAAAATDAAESKVIHLPAPVPADVTYDVDVAKARVSSAQSVRARTETEIKKLEDAVTELGSKVAARLHSRDKLRRAIAHFMSARVSLVDGDVALRLPIPVVADSKDLEGISSLTGEPLQLRRWIASWMLKYRTKYAKAEIAQLELDISEVELEILRGKLQLAVMDVKVAQQGRLEAAKAFKVDAKAKASLSKHDKSSPGYEARFKLAAEAAVAVEAAMKREAELQAALNSQKLAVEPVQDALSVKHATLRHQLKSAKRGLDEWELHAQVLSASASTGEEASTSEERLLSELADEAVLLGL